MKKLPFVMLSLAALAFVGCNPASENTDDSTTNSEQKEKQQDNKIVLQEETSSQTKNIQNVVPKLSGIYGGVYENTPVELNFDTNTITYPSLGCSTTFEVTNETDTKLTLKEKLATGECNVNKTLYVKFNEDNKTNISFKNSLITYGTFKLAQTTHKDGFINPQGSADQLLSNTINYTPTGFEIHTKFQKQGTINLFLEYDKETLYKEDTLLSKDITNIAKDGVYGVDINCTYTDKENSNINTLLCDDMNSQEDSPIEIGYAQEPIYLSWSNSVSYQVALLNLNPSEADKFDEAAYNQELEIAKRKANQIAMDKYNVMSPYIVTSLEVPGANDLKIDRDYIYLAAQGNGLSVLKIEDNNTLSLVATKDTNNALGIAIAGNYAYIADGKEGMKIIDISTPSSPKIKGIVDTNGTASAIVVDGDYAYISNTKGNEKGLKVLDISDKDNPTVIGYDNNNTGPGLLKKDDYIYTRLGVIIDVSDPTNPKSIDVFHTGFTKRFMAIDNDHIITQNSTIDITDPTNIKEDNNFTTYYTNIYDSIQNIKVKNNIGYIADNQRGFTLLDMSDLSNIRYLANTSYNLGSCTCAVDITDDFAYVIYEGKFRNHTFVAKINIKQKTSPIKPIKSLEFGKKIIQNNLLYNLHNNTLTISSIDDLNITQLSTLNLKKAIWNPKGSFVTKVNDTLFYLYQDGIAAVDVSDKNNPKNIAILKVADSSYPTDLEIVDSYAYITRDNGFYIVDINDSKNMKLITTNKEYKNIEDIAIKENYAFLSDGRIAIIDISDKENPIFVRYFTNNPSSGDIIRKDNYLYAYDGDDKFKIYDISIPINPIKLSYTNKTPFFNDGLKVVDNYLLSERITYPYSYHQLSITDISSKKFPKQVGVIGISGELQQVVGDYLFTDKYMFDISGLKGK